MATVFNELGRTLNRAWQGRASGWRDLMRTTGSALTRYAPASTPQAAGSGDWAVETPSWGLLLGEILETKKSLVVQIELPGVERDDVDVIVQGGALRVRGEKRANREYFAQSYYLRERAFGRFERVVSLPRNVDPGGAKASYRGGVLTVELPKTATGGRQRVVVR